MKKLLSVSAMALVLLAGCSSEAKLSNVTSYNNDVQKEVMATDWNAESKDSISKSLEQVKTATSERDIESLKEAKSSIEAQIVNVNGSEKGDE